MTTYMICPISAIETFDDFNSARTQAELLTRKLGSEAQGFAVYKVEEVGRYEHVSPVWLEPKVDRETRTEFKGNDKADIFS